MILIGNQRGGAHDLATHLLKDENEHVSVHELRGFASDDLHEAFDEVDAISQGTRCKQYLFSMSFNPPVGARVSTASFEAAIDAAEDRLGLSGQPRAVLFHEKEGPGGVRRHAHAVWSRIDAEEMKAIPLSFTRRKMQSLSRDLYQEHGWEMPKGLRDASKRDPKNFTLAEWQECKRKGLDPRQIKGAVQDAWAVSDNAATLSHALAERGLVLAKGDRRGAVVLDHNAKPYALARYAGIKAKDVKTRLGEAPLLSMAEAQDQIARDMVPALKRMRTELDSQDKRASAAYEQSRAAMAKRQRKERADQLKRLEARHWKEARERQERFKSGLAGLWDRLRGGHARIQRENEHAAYEAMMRDRTLKDDLILRHIEQRRALSIKHRAFQTKLQEQRTALKTEQRNYEAMRTPLSQRSIKAEFNKAADEKRNARKRAFLKERSQPQTERDPSSRELER